MKSLNASESGYRESHNNILGTAPPINGRGEGKRKVFSFQSLVLSLENSEPHTLRDTLENQKSNRKKQKYKLKFKNR